MRIRRKVATDAPDVAFYGVELEELDQALREAFYSCAGQGATRGERLASVLVRSRRYRAGDHLQEAWR